MSTNLQNQDFVFQVGMDSRTSKVALADQKLRLAQNVHWRTTGAITKRDGFTKINRSQPQN